MSDIVNTVSGGDTPPNCTACTVTTPTAANVTVSKALINEGGTQAGIAEPGEVLTYDVTLNNTGGAPFTNFRFVENIPAGATLTSVTGATGFTGPVTGPGTLELTVASIAAATETTVQIQFTVADPLPETILTITNLVSGGDVPSDCGPKCSVELPTSQPKLKIEKTGKYEDSDGNGSTTCRRQDHLHLCCDQHWQRAARQCHADRRLARNSTANCQPTPCRR